MEEEGREGGEGELNSWDTVCALVDVDGEGDGFTVGAATGGGGREILYSHIFVLVFMMTLSMSPYSEKVEKKS